jgi:hypothetical protein
MSAAYAQSGEASDILSLKDKESVVYSFTTLRQLDSFWGHAQNIVVRATPASEAVFTYDPHYWFYIGRKETERALVDEVTLLGKQFLMTVAGVAPLDKTIQPEFNNELRQYHMEKVFDKEKYYVVVIGDYIFESRFPDEVENKIEAIYARHTALNDEAAKELEEIQNLKARTRLKISRNRTKAHKLKTKLSKNFYIKK